MATNSEAPHTSRAWLTTPARAVLASIAANPPASLERRCGANNRTVWPDRWTAFTNRDPRMAELRKFRRAWINAALTPAERSQREYDAAAVQDVVGEAVANNSQRKEVA